MSALQQLKEELANKFVRGTFESLPFRNGNIQAYHESVSDPDHWILRALPTSITGKIVTPTTSLQLATVFSCVRLLSETVAGLPCVLMKRISDRNRERARDHWLYPILHDLPNPEMTSAQVKEAMMVNLLLRGKTFAEKVMDRGGRIREIWPLMSQDVEIFRDKPDSGLKFRVTETGRPTRTLSMDKIWYISGLSWNGIEGLSPIGLARETLGLAMAEGEYGARTFKNAARMSGILEYPGKFKEETRKNVEKSFAEAYAGVENTGKTPVLEEGLKYNKISMTNEDAQWFLSRQFSIQEICRIFRVPLHMVYYSETQPRANMEQASLEFVQYSMSPWIIRIEQTALRDLIPVEERQRLYLKLNVDGLLRGDYRTRMEGHAIGRRWGFLSKNDVREKEDWNEIPDGDDYSTVEEINQSGNELKEVSNE